MDVAAGCRQHLLPSMFSTGDGHLLRVTHRGSATVVQRLRPSRERRRGELRPVGVGHRARFAGVPGEWKCLGGDVLRDSRTMDWSPFLLFISEATAGDRQIGLARLALDGSWHGFELVQEFPSLGPGDMHVWLGDGPVVCIHDDSGADAGGRLLVLSNAAGEHHDGSAWQHCVLSLSHDQSMSVPESQSAPRARNCALLYCGAHPSAHGMVQAATSSVLLAESSQNSQTVLRWLAVKPGDGEAGLTLEAQSHVSLAHSYCTAQPCSICWDLRCTEQVLNQPVVGSHGTCFIGLENGRLLMLSALEILGAGGNDGQAAALIHSRDLATGRSEPVLHLQLAVFGNGVEAGGAEDVIVAQQRTAVHLISAANLAVLKSVSLTMQPSHAIPAEKVLRHAALLHRFSEGCAGGLDELVLVDVSAAGHDSSVPDARGGTKRLQWKISTAGCFALHGSDLAPDAGGEANIVGRCGIDWQYDNFACGTGSQSSTSSLLTQESSQDGSTNSGDSNDTSKEVQAIESFTASLQHRLRVAQQSLHHKQRLLVEKGSLIRYTQKLLVETAAGFAVGAGVSTGSAFSDNDRIARTGLRPLVKPSDDTASSNSADEARVQASMAAAGFIPTGFAGLVVPKVLTGLHGHVAVVSISQHTVAGGGNNEGNALDLCLEVGVRNFGVHAVHDVSITVLPWRCAAGSTDPTSGAASSPSLAPLPSLSSGLRVLPADGGSGIIQAVIGVSELLGLRDQHTRLGMGYEQSQQRVTIGSPQGRCVRLSAVVLWQQSPAELSSAGFACHVLMRLQALIYLSSVLISLLVPLKEYCCHQELPRAKHCVPAPVGDVARGCRHSGICYGARWNKQSSRGCSRCRARSYHAGGIATFAARGAVQINVCNSGTRDQAATHWWRRSEHCRRCCIALCATCWTRACRGPVV